MGIVIVGGTSGVGADVDTNKNQHVITPSNPVTTGFVRLASDEGVGIEVSENGYVKTSLDSMIFYDQVDGSNINTNLWTWVVTGAMAAAQANGFITLNSGSITTINTNVVLTSIKNIPFYADMPLRVLFNAKVTNLPIANAQAEIGIGAAVAAGTPTDGAYFRWTSGGAFIAVINNNGTEITSASLTGVFTNGEGSTVTLPPTAGTCYAYEIVVVEDLVQFYVDDVLVAELAVAAANAYPFNSGRQTVFARVFNSGSAPASAPTLNIGQVEVNQQDLNQNKLWKESLVALGRGSYQSPVTAFGQTANNVNITAPGAAALANATASYTTLGGLFRFVSVAGAETDYPLFAFQVPAGYQFHCTGIKIDGAVAVIMTATATLLQWSVGVNASAASLLTVDAVGPPQTWAGRRTTVGTHGLLGTAPVGTTLQPLQMTFDPPLVTDSARFFCVIMREVVGAATGEIRGNVTVTGYFE